MLDNYALNLVLHTAKDWASTNNGSFSRFFSLDQVDRQWLLDCSEVDIQSLADLPTSIIQVNLDEVRPKDLVRSSVMPSAEVTAISGILGAIAENVRSNVQVGMIAWGISSQANADWLCKSSLKDRIALASQGKVTFSSRTPFSRIARNNQSGTDLMANLMRILSGGKANG
ncbi:hypothetical protein GR140_31400 (plasmid) [Pseudomonas putida]|uniref:hypothetical protein n=1 Tax=Pseudomonas putida TaxID=303 RepID=UPI001BAEE683|nr:hypothetical protein [Pseudomonas putida]QUG93250.1 hypothetical protein GR140_31400 [Pseudomonas putida]